MSSPPICGGHSAVKELSDTHNEMVQFAFDELTAEGSLLKHPTFIPKQIVDVVEFTQQVVSGMNYSFHLILADKQLSEEEKVDENVAKKKVKITVYDQPWTNTRQVSQADWMD